MFSFDKFIDKYFLLFIISFFILVILVVFIDVKKEERIEIELIKGQKNNVVIYSKDNCKFINYSYYCWED